jgi:hypothetical protein
MSYEARRPYIVGRRRNGVASYIDVDLTIEPEETPEDEVSTSTWIRTITYLIL